MKKSFHLILLCILAGFFFTASAQKVKKQIPTVDSRGYRYIAPEKNTGIPLEVFPHFENYWTGSCDSSTKTHESEVLAGGFELGWMVFDVSDIPLDATINSITFYGYVHFNNSPHWSITPIGSVNPVSGNATDIYNQVSNNYHQGVAYSYNDGSGTLAEGWLNRVLDSSATTDMQNALPQGWFAIGIVDWDFNANNYIHFRGWYNYAWYPYLVIDCTLPSVFHDVGTASVDVPSFVPDGLVVPKATLFSQSTITETFNVTMTITPGSYSSTKTVINLEPGEIKQVTFDNWITTPHDYIVEACTQLVTDPNPANNCKTKIVRCQHIFSSLLYEQMSNPGTHSYTSQNFEAMFDSFDTQAADDFVIASGQLWCIANVEVLGVYYNGTGPANSLNVWFYNNVGGHPGTIAASAMNIVPSFGIETGSFVITFPPPFICLTEGTYWLSIQCNMDLAVGGQWGWTEQLPANLESNWQNPGGGFLTPCTSWRYRVTECQVGTSPYYDFSFSLGGPLIPVELTSFTARADYGVVELQWITATETNNQGFEVQRSAGGEFETIAFVEGHGTTTETQVYIYQDRTVGVGSYSYRLKQIDFGGTFEYSDVIAADVPAPAEFALDQNYPNPFNPSTKIAFRLAVDSKVSLKVFDILGQEVATLINNDLDAGLHNVTFNAAGINSGVFFFRIDATGDDGQNFTQVRKMILAK